MSGLERPTYLKQAETIVLNEESTYINSLVKQYEVFREHGFPDRADEILALIITEKERTKEPGKR